MEDVFWSLEDDEGDAPDAPTTMPSSSPQHIEHTIQGSPLWLVSGLAVVGMMIVTPTDWGWWLPLIALAMLGYGFFEYVKTVIVSWNQEQQQVEVFEGSKRSSFALESGTTASGRGVRRSRSKGRYFGEPREQPFLRKTDQGLPRLA